MQNVLLNNIINIVLNETKDKIIESIFLDDHRS